MDKFNNKKDTDVFFKAVLSLKNEEECKIFFDDICTIGELNSISQRLSVAMLLSEGNTFNEVAKITGASSATISRVNKCLNYGQGGYETIIERLKGK